MQDKAKLGNRYTCYQCGCRFYDLNRPEPTCPECSADQREAPVRDIKALLKSGKKRVPVVEEPAPKPAAKETEDDDDGLGLLDNADAEEAEEEEDEADDDMD